MSIAQLADVEPFSESSERVPPHNLFAEQSVLGAVMLSTDALAEVAEVLRPEDFYVPKHEMIFEAALQLFSHGNPCDAIAVGDALGKSGALRRVGGPEYLHTLTSLVPTSANAGYYADIIAEKATLRRLINAGTRIVQTAFEGEGEVSELVNLAQAEIYAVSEVQEAEAYTSVDSSIQHAVDELARMLQGGGRLTGLPTGFGELDEVTNGLQAGAMVVVAARPAMGKSTFALNLARVAAIGHNEPTLFFSLEMGKSEIAEKILAAESGVPLHKIRNGSTDQREWERVADQRDRFAKVPLYLDDSPNMTLVEIRAKCRRLKQQHGLRLVVIDYLQLMTSGRRIENRQQEVSEFSRALKLLAKELQVPVVALSQLNRASEVRADKRPQLADLRESGAIEQDADVVILLHRDDVYRKKGDAATGDADVIIAKNRNGPINTFKVTFSGSLSRFEDHASFD